MKNHFTGKHLKQYTLDFEKPIRELEMKINELEELAQKGKIGLDGEIKKLWIKAEKLRKDVYSKLTRWQHVQLARHPMRPYALDYIKMLTTGFVELHGDRNFRDDKAIVAGLAHLSGTSQPPPAEHEEAEEGTRRSIAIIAQQKGRGTKDNLERNFAMPHPEGYRKARRVMRLAEKFNLPILTIIDTPGAYPGLGAEERGQAAAIAENLYEMAQLKVPIIAVIIGEGGSGGALALGVADRVYMLRYSIYSVISPEGCASILYHDATFAKTAADALKLTAPDLLKTGLIDGIIEEPLESAHYDPGFVAGEIKQTINTALDELIEMDPGERIQIRIDKYAKMGRWKDEE